MKKQSGFTLVELMVVIGIIGVITAIAVPYYNNYKKTACDQAALVDLYNVRAAVQKKLTDDALSASGPVATDYISIGEAVTAVLADSTGKYGYPGPTTKCKVALTSGGTFVISQTPIGTDQGIKGWALDMAGGEKEPAAWDGSAVSTTSSSGSGTGTSGSGATTDTSASGSGTTTSGGSSTGSGTSDTSGSGSTTGGTGTTTTTGSPWATLAAALGTNEAALKALSGVSASQINIPWGEVQKATGLSVDQLKALAGVTK